MQDSNNIDHLLRDWPYEPDGVSVRVAAGDDGRRVLQMRIDMGILQLEINGRPDGTRPHGEESMYDHLVARACNGDGQIALTEEQCDEIDREFVQFYHRRICWLKLENYPRAVCDADHTLARLTDF